MHRDVVHVQLYRLLQVLMAFHSMPVMRLASQSSSALVWREQTAMMVIHYIRFWFIQCHTTHRSAFHVDASNTPNPYSDITVPGSEQRVG